jgi:hypothetical protein
LVNHELPPWNNIPAAQQTRRQKKNFVLARWPIVFRSGDRQFGRSGLALSRKLRRDLANLFFEFDLPFLELLNFSRWYFFGSSICLKLGENLSARLRTLTNCNIGAVFAKARGVNKRQKILTLIFLLLFLGTNAATAGLFLLSTVIDRASPSSKKSARSEV